MNRGESVVILGGGIWGLSTAYYLARVGWTDVEVLERNGALFDETTSQAAGLVGQIRATPLMRRAIRYAIDLFLNFEMETDHDPGFHQVGSLLLALTSERMASFEEHVEHANRNGVEAHFVDGAEMFWLAPHLDVSLVDDGYFVPEDGYLDPRRCAQALCGAAEDLGVRFRTGTAATGLSIKDGRVMGVETDDGFVEAEHVVVTTGPWTGIITEMAGHRTAMVPIRHQRVTTTPVSGIPDYHPVVRVTDESCYLRPEEGGTCTGISSRIRRATTSSCPPDSARRRSRSRYRLWKRPAEGWPPSSLCCRAWGSLPTSAVLRPSPLTGHTWSAPCRRWRASSPPQDALPLESLAPPR